MIGRCNQNGINVVRRDQFAEVWIDLRVRHHREGQLEVRLKHLAQGDNFNVVREPQCRLEVAPAATPATNHTQPDLVAR